MNEFILANLYSALKTEGLKVYVQQKVPANDGGIALGQLMVANAMRDG